MEVYLQEVSASTYVADLPPQARHRVQGAAADYSGAAMFWELRAQMPAVKLYHSWRCSKIHEHAPEQKQSEGQKGFELLRRKSDLTFGTGLKAPARPPKVVGTDAGCEALPQLTVLENPRARTGAEAIGGAKRL